MTEKFITSGIAICNVCLKPCKVGMDLTDRKLVSNCCHVSIVHRNVKLKFQKEKFP